MKIMWKPKSAKADDIIATVVNTAALSAAGVAITGVQYLW